MTEQYEVKCNKCGSTRLTFNDPRLAAQPFIECKAKCFESHKQWTYVRTVRQAEGDAAAAPPAPPADDDGRHHHHHHQQEQSRGADSASSPPPPTKKAFSLDDDKPKQEEGKCCAIV